MLAMITYVKTWLVAGCGTFFQNLSLVHPCLLFHIPTFLWRPVDCNCGSMVDPNEAGFGTDKPRSRGCLQMFVVAIDIVHICRLSFNGARWWIVLLCEMPCLFGSVELIHFTLVHCIFSVLALREARPRFSRCLDVVGAAGRGDGGGFTDDRQPAPGGSTGRV